MYTLKVYSDRISECGNQCLSSLIQFQKSINDLYLEGLNLVSFTFDPDGDIVAVFRKEEHV